MTAAAEPATRLPLIGDRAPGFVALLGISVMQTADRDGVSCPANWRPGDDVLLGAPRTQAEVEARQADERVKLVDWYLAGLPGRPV